MKKSKPIKAIIEKRSRKRIHPKYQSSLSSENRDLVNYIINTSKYSPSTASSSLDDNDKKISKQELQKITNQISNEIEHILIEVYNYHISSANSQIKSLNLVGFQEQILKITERYKIDTNALVINQLLLKIKELIGRYKTKIFEIGDIKNLRDSFYRSKIRKNQSPNHFLPPTIYTSKFSLPSSHRQHITYLNSYPQTKDHLIKSTIRTIFSELRNIKRSLSKSAKDIEIIFKEQKEKFTYYSIELCQREEYLKTLVNDKFIQMLIAENREEEFENLIYEIEEDKDNKVYQMTDFLNYLKNFSFVSDENTQDEFISLNEEPLEFESSLHEEQWVKPKDTYKPPNDIDELVKYIVTDEKKGSKKKKKKNKKSNNSNNIGIVSKEEDEYDEIVEQFKEEINKISSYSYNTQKIKISYSQDWLNKINNFDNLNIS